jgi:hypothetical protein
VNSGAMSALLCVCCILLSGRGHTTWWMPSFAEIFPWCKVPSHPRGSSDGDVRCPRRCACRSCGHTMTPDVATIVDDRGGSAGALIS